MTLDSIRERSTKGSFPVEVLEDASDALLLFGAGFLGANDGIFVLDAGVEHVTVVDADKAKLEEMRGLYPSHWSFELREARDYASTDSAIYDVVVVDPWTQEMDWVLNEAMLWHRLTYGFLVIGVCAPWFQAQQLPTTLLGFNTWSRHIMPNLPQATKLHKRSDYRGGVYWVVIPGSTR